MRSKWKIIVVVVLVGIDAILFIRHLINAGVLEIAPKSVIPFSESIVDEEKRLEAMVTSESEESSSTADAEKIDNSWLIGSWEPIILEGVPPIIEYIQVELFIKDEHTLDETMLTKLTPQGVINAQRNDPYRGNKDTNIKTTTYSYTVDNDENLLIYDDGGADGGNRLKFDKNNQTLYFGEGVYMKKRPTSHEQKEAEITTDSNNTLEDAPQKSVEAVNASYTATAKKKADDIIYAFTNYAFLAQKGQYQYAIEISEGEINEDGLILKGKMIEFVTYSSSDLTPRDQVISMATGNRQVTANERVNFWCSIDELKKEWTVLESSTGFLVSIKVQIIYTGNNDYTIRTRLLSGGEDMPLTARGRSPF